MTGLRQIICDPHRRRVLIRTTVLIAGLGLCAVNMIKFQRAMRDEKPTLKRWLPIAAELGRDTALYEHHPDYLYPPAFLVFMRPLTWMPPWAAAAIWQILKYISVVIVFGIAWRVFDRPTPLAFWAKAASVIMSFRFIVSDVAHGNINLFMAVLVFASLYALVRVRPVASGVLLAVAAAIKVTPALWVVYLAYKRMWRALIGVTVGLAIMLLAVPLLVVSPAENVDLLGAWYRHVVHRYVATGQVYSHHLNQSLAAVTNRLFGLRELTAGEGVIITLVEISPATITWIQRGLMGCILLGLGWGVRGRVRPEDRIDIGIDWAAVGAATLLLSGYTWTGHYCYLVLGYVAALWYLQHHRASDRGRCIFILTIVSFLLGSLSGDLLTAAGREIASALGAKMFATVALLAALVMIRRRRSSRAALSEPRP